MAQEIARKTQSEGVFLKTLNHPVTQSLCLLGNTILQLVPQYGGAIATGVFGTVAAFQQHRLETLITEIDKLLKQVAEEKLGTEEFHHLFLLTGKKAVDTYHEEKIRLFARVFATYANGETDYPLDIYEECLSVLDDLSLREFHVLRILDVYEKSAPIDAPEYMRRTKSLNEGFWLPFLETVEKEAGIPKQEIPGILERLRRTGLYQTWAGSGMRDFTWEGLSLDFDVGHLTPNFDTFIKVLALEH